MLKSKIQNPKSKINPKSKYRILKHKFYHLSFIICAFLLIILMSGCATLWEGAKGIAGISTKVLQDNRKYALIKIVNYDYTSCYTKTLDILKRMGAYVYAQNREKHIIAIYVSEEDTTPVGLFFKEIDTTNTQVEVSSPSTYAKELIAGKLFLALDKSLEKSIVSEED